MSDLATVEDLDRVGKTVETAVLSMTSAVEAQTAAMEKLAQAMTDQRHVESARAAGGRAEIHVNMGGWGVAIAVACAMFCLLLTIDMRNDQRDSNRKIERSQDYDNMLWQRYPELRPENLQDKTK